MNNLLSIVYNEPYIPNTECIYVETSKGNFLFIKKKINYKNYKCSNYKKNIFWCLHDDCLFECEPFYSQLDLDNHMKECH